MSEQLVLLNPGPVNVSERVRAAMSGADLCHREPEFATLMSRLRAKLQRLCGGDDVYTTLLLTGSGTSALEAGLTSVIADGARVLVISNGHYGERILQILQVHGILSEVLHSAWGEPPDLNALDACLAANPDLRYVALVHHETSTGLLNPLREIGSVAKRHQRAFIVDAVSSLGGEAFHCVNDHVDVCISTANKCLRALPGLSFVCLRTSLLETPHIPERTLYLDLRRHRQAQDAGQPAFTPAVQLCYALDAALDELEEEGLDARLAHFQQLADVLRDGLEALDIELLLPRTHYGRTITSARLSASINYDVLHDDLKEDGFVIYQGQSELAQTIFRVAHMGVLDEATIRRFLDALAQRWSGRPALTST